LGGMFDPVHFGHLNIALSSLEKLKLDEVHLLPCGQPVHKNALFTSSKHRLAMLQIVANENPFLSIDERECRSAEPSYTLKSLQAIRHENPDARLSRARCFQYIGYLVLLARIIFVSASCCCRKTRLRI